MKIIKKGKHSNIAVVQDDKFIITDLQSALDFAMAIHHETGICSIVIPKDCVTEEFFVLSSQLAGEILQKYVNYGIYLAVVGDYSGYTSKPLHDFIYESNHGRYFYFVATEEEAIKKIEASIRTAGIKRLLIKHKFKRGRESVMKLTDGSHIITLSLPLVCLPVALFHKAHKSIFILLIDCIS